MPCTSAVFTPKRWKRKPWRTGLFRCGLESHILSKSRISIAATSLYTVRMRELAKVRRSKFVVHFDRTRGSFAPPPPPANTMQCNSGVILAGSVDALRNQSKKTLFSSSTAAEPTLTEKCSEGLHAFRFFLKQYNHKNQLEESFH